MPLIMRDGEGRIITIHAKLANEHAAEHAEDGDATAEEVPADDPQLVNFLLQF